MKAKWIKVSDRLPEEGQMVMIVFWNGVVHTGSLINGKWHSNWNDYDIDLATHWMPMELPEDVEAK
jgi:hypothetical protein